MVNMREGFIKNVDLLEESYRTDDFLGFTKMEENFRSKLDKIDKNSMIGLIGRFGSGKSTMLYQLYKDDKNIKEKWFIFDAWKYPNRENLWEGFVLDLCLALGKKTYEEVRKKIDGEQQQNLKTLINAIGDIPIPGMSVVKNFNHFIKTSPAKRVSDVQDILKKVIKKEKKELFVVLEDVDRSGDKGIYFLETLKNFIKEIIGDEGKNIMVIVPIGDKSFESDYKNSYIKCLDYYFEFEPHHIDFTLFIKKLFDDDFLKEEIFVKQINFLLRKIIREYDITIRELKSLIRRINLEYQNISDSEKSLNIGIFLLFRVSRIYKKNIETDVKDFKTISNQFWGYDFLIWLANSKNIADVKSLKSYVGGKVPIVLESNKNSNMPYFDQHSIYAQLTGGNQKGVYMLSDKYLEY
jgi:KAP family P-loop domain